MKKLVCLVLVLILSLSMAAPALAGDTLTLWIFLNPESNDDARSPIVKKIVES